MADTVVQELVINTLTQAQFDAAKEAGTLTPYELYGTPDTSADRDLMNITDGAKELMAHSSMPSSTYKDLTLGASGTKYTAPADGWFYLQKTAGTAGAYVSLSCGNMVINQAAPGANNSMAIFIPAGAGKECSLTYSATGTGVFRFVYAEGAKHLA